MRTLSDSFAWMEARATSVRPVEKVGRVVRVTGTLIEAEGPDAVLGQLCEIISEGASPVPAEVVGFRDNRLLLMPLAELRHLRPGSRVVSSPRAEALPIGRELLGRVLNGMGQPIDGRGVLRSHNLASLHNNAPNPMLRRPVTEPFTTGIRAVDAFMPMGRGQRMGIFAGSGVGKSTLLGMIARGAESEVNVIALVGERGRELREFIERDLGTEGLAKSIVIVSTSDEPAALRLHAARYAARVAEFFRDEGLSVLFLMDSVTRLAMAQREIGLSVGEPPTSRGYTPSVFALLPRLLERSGNGSVGSITAFYTVLVEGDDMNEPVADAVRGILDGHMVLSRELATANHFPAIDVLESLSRVAPAVTSEAQWQAVSKARDLLALYRKHEDLVMLGAYKNGTNSALDNAIKKQASLTAFLRQKTDEFPPREATFTALQEIVT